MATREVISTLTQNSTDVMEPHVLGYHYPNASIPNGSLLTVESNHFAVLKSRGALLSVYETGQHVLETPDKPLLGSIQQAWFSNSNPWQYEVIYVNRAKLVLEAEGEALSREMASLKYHVSAYIHVDTKEDAEKLVQHMPFNGHFIQISDVQRYADPVIQQAINHIVQLTKLESINEKMPEILDLVKGQLEKHFDVYGIHLNDVKALVRPSDPRMMEIISFQALGLQPDQAIRAWLTAQAIEKGLISAPNILAGQGFQIGAPQVSEVSKSHNQQAPTGITVNPPHTK